MLGYRPKHQDRAETRADEASGGGGIRLVAMAATTVEAFFGVGASLAAASSGPRDYGAFSALTILVGLPLGLFALTLILATPWAWERRKPTLITLLIVNGFSVVASFLVTCAGVVVSQFGR